MAIQVFSSTGKIPGIKVETDTLAEAAAYVGQLDKGELIFVNAAAVSDGGLYYVASDKSLIKICEVGSEVTP